MFEAYVAGGDGPPDTADEVGRAAALIGAAALAAPVPSAEAPVLARLLGPKGPSWLRALPSAPGRVPADVARLFPLEAPFQAEVARFAASLDLRSAGAVEAALLRALA